MCNQVIALHVVQSISQFYSFRQ